LSDILEEDLDKLSNYMRADNWRNLKEFYEEVGVFSITTEKVRDQEIQSVLVN